MVDLSRGDLGCRPCSFFLSVSLWLLISLHAFGSPTGVEFCSDTLDVKALDRLATLGYLSDIHLNTRPIDPNEIALSSFTNLRDSSEINANLAARYLAHSSGLRSKTFLSLDDRSVDEDASLTLHLSDGSLIIHERVIITRNPGYQQVGQTASSRLKEWRWGYHADFSEAYIRAYVKRLILTVGRRSVSWSPARFGALTLSSNSPSLDMAMISYYHEMLSFHALAAVLDSMWNDQHDRYLARRYLAAHRLDCRISDRLELGLTEIALYGGDVRYPDPGYLNPIMPYYANQFNNDFDDNLLVGADFSLLLSSGMMAYGELLIDDLQYDADGPNAWGMTVGAQISGWSDIILEYTRLSHWIYTHRITEGQYLHHGVLLGYPIGPDADRLTAEWSKFISPDLWIAVRLSHTRKGEAQIEDRYVGENTDEIDFPSGVVERRITSTLDVRYQPRQGIWGSIELDNTWSRNADHVEGKAENITELKLKIGCSL